MIGLAALPTFGQVWQSRQLRSLLLAFLLFSIAEWGTWVAVLVWAASEGGPNFIGVAAAVRRGEMVRFAAGDLPIVEGDSASDVFFIVEGEVVVAKGCATLALCGPGDVVGEIAALHGCRVPPRSPPGARFRWCAFPCLPSFPSCAVTPPPGP